MRDRLGGTPTHEFAIIIEKPGFRKRSYATEDRVIEHPHGLGQVITPLVASKLLPLP